MADRNHRVVTQFKTSRWKIIVQRRSPVWKIGPDKEVVNALSNVATGKWQKGEDFVDALSGIEGIISIQMIDHNGDGTMTNFEEI